MLTPSQPKLSKLGYTVDQLDFEPLFPQIDSYFEDGVDPINIGSGELAGNTTVQDGYLQSSNYETGVAGWQLTPTSGELNFPVTLGAGSSIGGWSVGADYIRDTAGVVGLSSAVTGGDDIRFWAGDATPANAEFRVTESGLLTATNAVITGTITASSGTIGGWTIASTSLTSGSGATTVGLDSGGSNPAIYAGSATPASAPFRVTGAGAVTASNITITGGSIAGTPVSSIPNNSSTDISLLDYTHDLVFSSASKAQVNWASGTITLSNGRTFSISFGNTGTMAARTYVYLDTGVSSTVLQTTTTVSTAMGANKKLIAVCQNQTAEASFEVFNGIGGLKLTEANTSISNNDWTFSGTWSVSSASQVAWGSGTLTTSNGGSYSITGSNTGNMAAKTYIYFALGTSSTAFQTTTSPSTAIGAGKILIAIAQNGTNEANYMVMNDKQHNIDAANIVAGSITANEISTGTITADRMNVTQLSAITANMGTITAGSISVIDGANTIGFTPSGTNAIFSGTTGSPQFKVTPAGAITATSGSIGGWTLGTSSLSAGGGTVNLEATTERIRIGSASQVLSGTGIYMGLDEDVYGGYVFRAGNPSGAYMVWTGDDGNLIVNGGTIQTTGSGTRFVMSSTTFQGFDSGGDVVFEVILSGGNAGDVIMGDDASGSYAQWDNSAGTFNVYADNVPTTTQGFFGGDGSDGALTITSGTTTLSFGSANVLIKNYSTISITSTGKLGFSNPASDGSIAILKSQGNCTITSSSSSVIDLQSMGATGGAADTTGTTAFNISVASGIGGVRGGATGAGNGGAGGTGLTAIQRQLYIDAEYKLYRRFMNVMPGSGGGGGETGNIGAGGAGGRGAGALIIECGGAFNFTTGTMALNGATGQAGQGGGSGGGSGGGGGGAGGMALILYTTLTANTGTINTAGGAGGAGNNGTSASGITGGGGGGAGSPAGDGASGGAAVGGAGNNGANNSVGGGGGAGSTGGTGGTGGSAGSSSGGLVVQNKYFA